jgi:hypothetical protein
MRLVFGIACLFAATPALAMNWEGKEDWLNDLPQALEFGDQLPRPQAAPLKPCREEPADNPYEQVQIPGKNCMPPENSTAPKR